MLLICSFSTICVVNLSYKNATGKMTKWRLFDLTFVSFINMKKCISLDIREINIRLY